MSLLSKAASTIRGEVSVLLVSVYCFFWAEEGGVMGFSLNVWMVISQSPYWLSHVLLLYTAPNISFLEPVPSILSVWPSHENSIKFFSAATTSYWLLSLIDMRLSLKMRSELPESLSSSSPLLSLWITWGKAALYLPSLTLSNFSHDLLFSPDSGL